MAEQNLQRQGWQVYLPLIRQPRRRCGRWIEVIEPLFPRYLFLRFQSGHDDISPIRSTTGVHNLVRFSEYPATVPDSIVESLRRAADGATGLHYREPLFKTGDKVIVEQGPLAGLQAILVAETGQERVIILLEMLGRENRLNIKRDLLRLA